MSQRRRALPLTARLSDLAGHDMQSLLYNYLDEFLYRFSTDDFFVPKEVKILELKAKDTFSIKVQAYVCAADCALPVAVCCWRFASL